MATPKRSSDTSGSAQKQAGTAKAKASRAKSTSSAKQSDPAAKATRRAYIPWLIVGFVLIGLLWYLLAHQGGGLGGRISDINSSDPLRNAQVQLDENPPTVMNELTGAYVLNQIPPGNHKLKFSAAGYVTQELEVEIRPGQTRKLDIQLQPVPTEDRFSGRLTLIGSRDPNSLTVLDKAFKPLSKISLPNSPADGAALGELAFVADNRADQIHVLDLRAAKVLKTIQLPQFSGPVRLLLSPNGQTLLVLNAVAKNVSLINTTSYEVRQVISLPMAAIDMEILPDGGSVIAAGPGGLMRVFYGGVGSVDKPLNVATNLDSGIELMSGSNQVLVPGGRFLAVVDSLSGQFEEYELAQTVVRAAGVDTDKVLVAGGGKVQLYSLAQQQVVGNSFDFKQGEVRQLARWDDKWLLATSSPDALYLLDPNALGSAQQIDQRGKAQFVFAHSF